MWDKTCQGDQRRAMSSRNIDQKAVFFLINFPVSLICLRRDRGMTRSCSHSKLIPYKHTIEANVVPIICTKCQLNRPAYLFILVKYVHVNFNSFKLPENLAQSACSFRISRSSWLCRAASDLGGTSSTLALVVCHGLGKEYVRGRTSYSSVNPHSSIKPFCQYSQ